MVAKLRAPRKRLRAGFAAATPEAAGFAEGPLKELCEKMRQEVKAGTLAGAAHIILRGGRCVFAHADGWANKAKKTPFSLRSICKLHGCTKPLVCAAFLTLVDTGRVKLSDPISKYIPFSEVVTVKSKTRPVKEKPTLRHLITMTAGLKYEDCPAYAKVMSQIRKGEVKNLQGMCEGLAKAPLQAEPGSRYDYSFTADVLGRVCEAVSGKRLDKFVQASLLRPLGMRDTYFEVPPKKRSRMAVLYNCQSLPASKRSRGATHELKVWDHPQSAPGIMSGGGGILSYKDPGMLSSAQDYARFCHMLMNNGKALDGTTILKPSTARSLWSDALAEYGRKDGRLPGWHDSDGPGTRGGYWDHTGWSLLNTHLILDEMPRAPTKKARTATSMWMGGGGGTGWAMDTTNGTISVSFSQSFGGTEGSDMAKDAASFATTSLEEGAKAKLRGKGRGRPRPRRGR